MTALDLDRFIAELVQWAEAHGPEPREHRYGRHPEQVADLRLPEGSGPHPVAVLLHGGFWRARFTRANTSALAADLARRGFATWNVEYRRVGCGGGVPATLADVEAALAALAETGEPLALERAVAIGHSAGGQLALWAATTGRLAAACSLAGVCDLTAAAQAGLGDGAVLDFIGGTPEERPEAYELADPARRLPLGLPILLAHGDADDRVPLAQSRDFAEKARSAGDRCELLELPGADHFAPIDPRSVAWERIVARIAELAS